MQITAPTLSIVTPTYNRGDLIGRCYQSLKAQTCKDFEWIIVDDGSIDHTREVVQDFLKDTDEFKIKYTWKENAGKHTALNASHSYIRGKYVLILDSDDTLTENAVEIVLNGWKHYCKNDEIGFLTFLRKNSKDEICAYGEKEYEPVDVLNHKRICVISSDCCEVIRADLLRKTIFPTFKEEYFLAETALWYRVGWDYKCVYINKPIYICEYRKGGLTDSGRKMRVKNPLGGMYTSYLRMNRRCSNKERLKAGLLYVCYGKFAGLSTINLMKKTKKYYLLKLLCVIPGTIMYQFWKKKYC